MQPITQRTMLATMTRPGIEQATASMTAISDRTDRSSLVIRLLLVTLTAIGVIGIFLVAPAEAAASLG